MCALVIVLLSATGPAAARHASPGGSLRVQPVQGEGARPARSDRTPLRTRRAAGFLALIPSALLLVLYLYRRRPYVLAWTGSWALLAFMLDAVTRSADLIRDGRADAGGVVVGVARAGGVASALLLALAIHWFRAEPRIPRWVVIFFAAATAVLAGAARAVGLETTLLLAYGLIGVLYAVGGTMYLQGARADRMTGPVIIGIGMIGVASTYGFTASLVRQGATVEAPNVTVFIAVAWHALVAFGMLLMVFEDMSADLQATNVQLAQAQRDLEAAAVTDPLTGCYNRRFFPEVAAREIEGRRRHNLPLCLLFFDCDHLKLVNDTLGHAAGDDVLQAMAQVVRSRIRRSDYLFRWGGDEFLALVACDEAQGQAMARDIRHAFQAERVRRGLPPSVGVSLGCIGVPADVSDLMPLVREADQRMYLDKRRSA